MARPKDTRRRKHAEDAALAIWNGEFDDVRSAAEHFRPAHIGSEDGFRNFVDFVEEAYHELIAKNETASLRKRYIPLSERTIHRRRQAKPALRYLREFFGYRS